MLFIVNGSGRLCHLVTSPCAGFGFRSGLGFIHSFTSSVFRVEIASRIILFIS